MNMNFKHLYYKTKAAQKVIMSILVMSSAVWADNYYIDATNGKDSNNGRTPETAWKTIVKVNNTTFQPSDYILFKRGETWRETLKISSSGTSGNQIIFGAYGNGNKPIITSADIVSGWTESKPNIWTTSYTTKAKLVIFDGSIGRQESDNQKLNAKNEWSWDSNRLNIYSTDNPNQRTIEAGRRKVTIYTNNKNYLTFEYLDIRGNNSMNEDLEHAGLYIDGTNTIVKDCVARDNYYCGIRFRGGGGGDVLSCDIYDNMRSGIAIHSDAGQVLIDSCNIYNNGKISGESRNGIGADNTAGLTIKNCIIFNNGAGADKGYSHGIYLSGGGANGIIENNKIYDNPSGMGLACTWDNAEIRYNFIHGNRNAGIRLANQSTGGTVNIYYNVIADNEYGVSLIPWNWNRGTRVNIYNNVIYNNNYLGNSGEPANLDIRVDVKELNIKNNIIYDEYDYKIPNLIRFWNNGYRQSNMTCDNNCWFKTAGEKSKIVLYNNREFDFSNWQERGSDLNSKNSDPLFFDAANSNFSLQLSSPCVDAGINIGLIQDFYGNQVPQGKEVDIGAIEFTENGNRNPPPSRPKNVKVKFQ